MFSIHSIVSAEQLDGGTGCNTGIGRETARDLVAQGFAVVFACRDKAKAEQAMKEIEFEVGAGPQQASRFATANRQRLVALFEEEKKYSGPGTSFLTSAPRETSQSAGRPGQWRCPR